MNRAVLEQPFPRELVRTRKGSFGAELSYVEACHYIRRLNDAFDGQWSFRILSHEMQGSEVIVHGVLEAGGQVRHAFGGTTITTNKTTGELVSLADDLKAGATDALKKACSLFGIGLELYGTAQQAAEQKRGKPDLRTVPSNRATGQQGAAPADADDQSPSRNRLTARQLKALFAIARAQGLTDEDLKAESVKAYGVVPQFLSKADASSFIDALNGR